MHWRKRCSRYINLQKIVDLKIGFIWVGLILLLLVNVVFCCSFCGSPCKIPLIFMVIASYPEQGRMKAQELLKQYGLSDKDLNERFEFRNILPEEAEQATSIEKICFPPNEACSEAAMKERTIMVPDLFLVAVDKKTGMLAGFLNGISTNEYSFRDEFFPA